MDNSLNLKYLDGDTSKQIGCEYFKDMKNKIDIEKTEQIVLLKRQDVNTYKQIFIILMLFKYPQYQLNKNETIDEQYENLLELMKKNEIEINDIIGKKK